MAKRRVLKRKSETKVEKDEKKSEQIENGDASSKSPKKSKKSASKNEVKNKTPVSKPEKSVSDSEGEDTTDYEVEKIIDVRYKANKREFRIRWKNYTAKDDSWEPEEHLSCDELIAKFLENAEKAAKTPRKELRENRKSTTKFESTTASRKSRRTAGNRKNYYEDEDRN